MVHKLSPKYLIHLTDSRNPYVCQIQWSTDSYSEYEC